MTGTYSIKYSNSGIADGYLSNKSAYVTLSPIIPFMSAFPSLEMKFFNSAFSPSS